MKISEVAQATGLANSAIRFYEQAGLLPEAERSEGGYRQFNEQAVQKIRLIQMAQRLGFSLESIRAVMGKAKGTDAFAFDKEDLNRRMTERGVEIDQMIAALKAQRKELSRLQSHLQAIWEQGACATEEEFSFDWGGASSAAPTIAKAGRGAHRPSPKSQSSRLR